MSFDLDPKHRRAIQAGQHPDIRLTKEEAHAVRVGTVVVASNLTLEIEGTTHLRKEKGDKPWRLTYTVRDFRPRLLKRGAGYTRTQQLAVDDGGDAVTEEEQREITMEARIRQTAYESTERAEQLNRQRVRNLNRALTDSAVKAAHKGVDPTPIFARIERDLAALEEALDEAA